MNFFSNILKVVGLLVIALVTQASSCDEDAFGEAVGDVIVDTFTLDSPDGSNNGSVNITETNGTFSANLSTIVDYRVYGVNLYFSVDSALSSDDISFFNTQCGDPNTYACGYDAAFDCRFTIVEDPEDVNVIAEVNMGCGDPADDVNVIDQMGSASRFGYILVEICNVTCDSDSASALFEINVRP